MADPSEDQDMRGPGVRIRPRSSTSRSSSWGSLSDGRSLSPSFESRLGQFVGGVIAFASLVIADSVSRVSRPSRSAIGISLCYIGGSVATTTSRAPKEGALPAWLRSQGRSSPGLLRRRSPLALIGPAIAGHLSARARKGEKRLLPRSSFSRVGCPEGRRLSTGYAGRGGGRSPPGEGDDERTEQSHRLSRPVRRSPLPAHPCHERFRSPRGRGEW